MGGRLVDEEVTGKSSILCRIRNFYFNWKHKLITYRPVDIYLRLVEFYLSEYLYDIEKEFGSKYNIKFNNIRRDPVRALEVCLNKFHSTVGTNYWYGLSMFTSYFILHLNKLDIINLTNCSCIFDIIKEIKKLKPEKRFFRDLYYRFLISRKANLYREIDILMEIEDDTWYGKNITLCDYLRGTPLNTLLSPKYAVVLKNLMFRHTFVNMYLRKIIYLRYEKSALASDNVRDTVDILYNKPISDLKLRRMLLAHHEACYQELEQYVRRLTKDDELYNRYMSLLTYMLEDKDILDRYGYRLEHDRIEHRGSYHLILDVDHKLVTRNFTIRRRQS